VDVKVWRIEGGAVVESDGRVCHLPGLDWDELFLRDDPAGWVCELAAERPASAEGSPPAGPLAPVGSQEVWAAGVTYLRSRSARMEESAEAGASDFYDRVYVAPRPELFFKASPHRVVGPGGAVRVRRDSRWNVPEPELTVCLSAAGDIFGFTIGNDMSCRDIEGENPLYLPQAKVFDGCCALGPCLLLRDEPLPGDTEIAMRVCRGNLTAFAGTTTLKRMKRTPEELAEYLFRANSFPCGCFLLTGTGIVPPPNFALQPGDEVRITVEPIGTLVNRVA
jgi:2-dehydro-3-deoxy-D-arabinonate dehydratase